MPPDRFYRVALKGSIAIIHPYGFGFTVDNNAHESYHEVDKLPQWMQHKLAVLSTIDSSRPTGELDRIGRRVTEHIFWVYALPEETMEGIDGANAREKSKDRSQKDP